MSCLDSPIASCTAVHEIVLVDQTQAQCALEHGCPPDRQCPLLGYFAEPGDMAQAILAVQRKRRQ